MIDIAPPLIPLTDPNVVKGYATGRETYFQQIHDHPDDPLDDIDLVTMLSSIDEEEPLGHGITIALANGYEASEDEDEDRRRWKSWYIGYVLGQLSGAILPYRTEEEYREYLIDELLKPLAGTQLGRTLKQRYLTALAFFDAEAITEAHEKRE
jgi:hypothetical protein